MATSVYQIQGPATWTSGGSGTAVHSRGFVLAYRGTQLSMGQDGLPWKDFHAILDQEVEGVLQVTDVEAYYAALLPGEEGTLTVTADRIGGGEGADTQIVCSGALIVPGGKLEVPHARNAEADVHFHFVSTDGVTSPIGWSQV